MNIISRVVSKILNPTAQPALVSEDVKIRCAALRAQNAALERECGQLAKEEQSMLAQLAARDREIAACDRKIAALDEKLSPAAIEAEVQRALRTHGYTAPSTEFRSPPTPWADRLAGMTPAERTVAMKLHRAEVFAAADALKKSP